MRRIRSITPAALGIVLVQSIPGLLGDPMDEPSANAAPRVHVQASTAAAPTRSSGTLPSRPRPAWPSPSPTPAGDWVATEASWYDVRPTACYDDRGRHEVQAHARWAAHRTLPCGTRVQVATDQGTLTLEVWDRGPYHPDRDLDLSVAAFAALAPPEVGVLDVQWRVLAAPPAT